MKKICTNVLALVIVTVLGVSCTITADSGDKEESPLFIYTSPDSMEWPDESNTGIPAGTTLTDYKGKNETIADGQIFENLIIDTRIYVKHANVIIRNCLLRGANDDYYVVYTTSSGGDLTIERCEITNGIAIKDGFTGRANYIHAPENGYCNDGYSIQASNILIENNLIKGMRGSDGAHLDGIQVMGGDSIIIRNNWIEATTSTEIIDGGVNAALFFSPYKAILSNVVADRNMFIQDEGYYPLRIYNVSGAVIVRNNYWNSKRKGLTTPYHFVNCTPTEWNGNQYEDGTVIEYK